MRLLISAWWYHRACKNLLKVAKCLERAGAPNYMCGDIWCLLESIKSEMISIHERAKAR